MDRPTIVLVPGAWHTPEGTYSQVVPLLTERSYPWVYVKTKTVGAEPPNQSVEDDVKAIHDVMLPLLDEGKQVVLVAHSYGGIPATVSTKDHSIEERKKRGEKGGIKGILYLTAFAIPKRGMNLLETFGGVWPPWMVVNGQYATVAEGPTAVDAFYSDLPKEEAEVLIAKITHHCLGAFLARVDYVATDLKIPSTYLVCKNDHLLPQSLQDSLVESVPGMRRHECEAGHCPMLSDPGKVALLIEKVAIYS